MVMTCEILPVASLHVVPAYGVCTVGVAYVWLESASFGTDNGELAGAVRSALSFAVTTIAVALFA